MRRSTAVAGYQRFARHVSPWVGGHRGAHVTVVKGLKIGVDTRDGVVHLTGTVNNSEEKDHAIELARETTNVRDVQANLTVKSK
jgi:hypothetical protein